MFYSFQGDTLLTLDGDTLAVIQVTVLGLTITEWMAKFREEVISFDLIGAMATDFFFAYDVFDFFNMLLHTQETFKTNWVYIVFVFGYIAMFKYVPQQPNNMDQKGAKQMTKVAILVSMFCNDIPFVIIRITTMAQYGLDVSDIIHPTKNIALIIFGIIQVYIIHKNSKEPQLKNQKTYVKNRCERYCSSFVGPAPSYCSTDACEAPLEITDHKGNADNVRNRNIVHTHGEHNEGFM